MTLGPSVIYHATSAQDLDALRNGTNQSVDLALLEVGLLSNIYLTGTTYAGGFLLRPHVYWIDAHGEKSGEEGAVTSATQTKNGGRAGAEFIYQVILNNGFNLEIGGGFTYHLVNYSVEYSGADLSRSEPENRFVPTISAGVGWAF